MRKLKITLHILVLTLTPLFALSAVAASEKADSEKCKDIKGINNTEGEVCGTPIAGSKFNSLKIGMPKKQVTDIVGRPTDQGSYTSGKAFIPFYHGGDTVRHEMVFKGKGRLIFSNNSKYNSSMALTRIIYNSKESGYR